MYLLILERLEDEFRVINACLRPLAACHGLHIITVEGLPHDNETELELPTSSTGAAENLRFAPPGTVNKVAYTIAANGGTQCGFCTPGFTMSLYDATRRQQAARNSSCGDCPQTEEVLGDIEDIYSGHICRCTGYRGLLLAAKKELLPASNRQLTHELSETPDNVIDVEANSYSMGSIRHENVLIESIDTNLPQRRYETPLEAAPAEIMLHTERANLMQDILHPPHPTPMVELNGSKKWFNADTWDRAKELVADAIAANVSYKLVRGNTSAGVYKDEEWLNVDRFINLNHIATTSAPVEITDRGLRLSPECTINNLTSFISNHREKYIESEALLSLLRRVAGNQVRNAGTVFGSISMAIKHGFLSDTFLGLVTGNTTVLVDFYENNTWSERPGALLFDLTTWQNQHFIIRSVVLPLRVIESSDLFVHCFKVARRLQNAHSLVNLGCRVERVDGIWKSTLFLGNFLTTGYLRLRSDDNEADEDTDLDGERVVSAHRIGRIFDDIVNMERDSLSLGLISRVIDGGVRAQLHVVVQATKEHDVRQSRVSIAAGLFLKTILRFLHERRAITLTDLESITSNVYGEKRLSYAHGKQAYRVNEMSFPVSEPMIKTTAVHQAMGSTKYTRTKQVPEGGVHATFFLSTKATGLLLWNEAEVARFSYVAADRIFREYGIRIDDSNFSLFRAIDLRGPNPQGYYPTNDANLLSSSSYQSFHEFLLADVEVVYYGQPIGILATPFQWCTEYLVKLLDRGDFGLVSYGSSYSPVLTLDGPSAIPVTSRVPGTNEISSVMVNRRFNTVSTSYDSSTDSVQQTSKAIGWYSNIRDQGDSEPPRIDFDEYRNDSHVVVEGMHEVGSQYHFYMETQCAFAEIVEIDPAGTETSRVTGRIVNDHPISRLISVAALGRTPEQRESHHPVAARVSHVHHAPVFDSDHGNAPRTPQLQMVVTASTQSTISVSESCSSVLTKICGGHSPYKDVVVKVPSLGGGFGGKEPQSKLVAIAATFVAHKLKKPCKFVLDRTTDMKMIGKRHPYRGIYKIAAERATGKICAMSMQYQSDAGVSYDCSLPVMDLSLLSAFNAYHIEKFVCRGDCFFTNRPTSTAFRSFGVIQAHQITEAAISHLCRVICTGGLNSFSVRKINFFEWRPRDTDDAQLAPTPFGQPVRTCNMDGVWASLSRRLCEKFRLTSQESVRRVLESPDAGYDMMQQAVSDFNQKHKYIKQGFSMLPLMYGISFTSISMNVMLATMTVRADGLVHIQSLGVEMGQGLETKLLQIASAALGIKTHRIRVDSMDGNNVSTVPSPEEQARGHNSYPGTGASTGTDLNGRAIMALKPEWERKLISFCGDRGLQGDPFVVVDENWVDFVAWLLDGSDKITLRAEYDMDNLLTSMNGKIEQGSPFYYFNYAAAMTRVQLDCLTGEWNILDADIVYDAGFSINSAIDIGQIEGGFMQGVGFVSSEEVQYVLNPADIDHGKLISDGTWTYKPPSTTEFPEQLNIFLYPCDEYDVELVSRPCQLSISGKAVDEKLRAVRFRDKSVNQDDMLDSFGVYSSKTTGEPPLVLGNTLFFALENCIEEFHNGQPHRLLQCPATTYSIINSLRRNGAPDEGHAA